MLYDTILFSVYTFTGAEQLKILEDNFSEFSKTLKIF